MKQMKYLMVLIAALLTGCASTSLPVNYEQLSAEQIKAMSSDRNAVAMCTLVRGPWGSGTSTYILLDRAAVVSGSITIGADCVSTIASQPKGP